jgi:hypothetical protein
MRDARVTSYLERGEGRRGAAACCSSEEEAKNHGREERSERGFANGHPTISIVTARKYVVMRG